MELPDCPPGTEGYEDTVTEKPKKPDTDEPCTKAEQEFQEHLSSLKINFEDGEVRCMVQRCSRDSSGKWTYLCIPCAATCSGESILQIHLSGRKHKNKISQRSVWPKSILKEKPIATQKSESTSEELREDDKFNKYREVTCHIQEAIDNLKTSLVGVEYLIENPPERPNCEPTYLCTLCNKQGHPRTIINHMTCFWHNVNYMKRHFPKAESMLMPYRGQSKYREGILVVMHRLKQRIEDTYGRMRPLHIDKAEFDKNREQITQWIFKSKHFSENDGCTFEEVVDINLIDTLYNTRASSKSAESISGNSRDPSPPVVAAPIKPVFNAFTPSAKRQERRAVSIESLSDISDVQEEQKKESSPYRPRVDSKSSSRYEPYPVKQKIPYRSRYSIRNDTAVEEKNPKSGYKYQLAEEKRMSLVESAKRTLAYHEKNPEKHPLYPLEWKTFWNKRYKELQAEGKDASKHDFKPEWIVFWTKRMKELHDEELRLQVMEMYRKLCISPSEVTTTPLGKRRSPEPKRRSPDVKRRSPDVKCRSPAVKRRSPDVKRRSPDVKRRSPDVKRRSPDDKRRSPDFKRRSPDVKRRSPGVKLRSPGVKLRSPGAKLRSPDVKRHHPDEKRRSPGIRRRSPEYIRHPTEMRRRSPESKRWSPVHTRRSPIWHMSTDHRRSPTDQRHSNRREVRSPSHYRSPPRMTRERSRSPRDRRRSPNSRSAAWLEHGGSPLSRRDAVLHLRNRSPVLAPSLQTVFVSDDDLEPDIGSSNSNMKSRAGSEISRRDPVDMRDERHYWYSSPDRGPDLRDMGPAENIVSTLRLLVALEDYLGSLGPKVVDLLTDALKMEKESANSSEKLLDSESALVLIETAKEKLKGAMQAGLVSNGAALGAVRAAIVRAASTLHEADSRARRSNSASTAKVSSTKAVLPVPGIGEVDRSQIAAQMAEALIAQGKTDVTSEELAQLVDAVVGMAEAKRMETGKSKFSSKSLTEHKLPTSETCGTASALQLLQSAYDENEKKIEKVETHDAMDGLSDSDLETLLKNFNELSAAEQHNLIAYLKKLEAREPLRVECLRQHVSGVAVNAAPILQEIPAKANSTVLIMQSDDDEDYTVDEVFQSATQKVKEDQIRQEMEIVKKSLENSKCSELNDSNKDNCVVDITKNISFAKDLLAMVQASMQSTAKPQHTALSATDIVTTDTPHRSFSESCNPTIVHEESIKPLLSNPIQLNLIKPALQTIQSQQSPIPQISGVRPQLQNRNDFNSNRNVPNPTYNNKESWNQQPMNNITQDGTTLVRPLLNNPNHYNNQEVWQTNFVNGRQENYAARPPNANQQYSGYYEQQNTYRGRGRGNYGGPKRGRGRGGFYK